MHGWLRGWASPRSSTAPTGRGCSATTATAAVTTVGWINRRVASAAYGGRAHLCHALSQRAAADVLAAVHRIAADDGDRSDRRWAASSGNQDATLHVWRVGKAGEELSMSGYPTKITALAFSLRTRCCWPPAGVKDVTVWDFGGRRPARSTPRILAAHRQSVTGLAWSPRGDMLAAVADDGCVAVWEPRAGSPGIPLDVLDRLDRSVPASAVCWVGSDRLVAAWADGTVATHRVG